MVSHLLYGVFPSAYQERNEIDKAVAAPVLSGVLLPTTKSAMAPASILRTRIQQWWVFANQEAIFTHHLCSDDILCIVQGYQCKSTSCLERFVDCKNRLQSNLQEVLFTEGNESVFKNLMETMSSSILTLFLATKRKRARAGGGEGQSYLMPFHLLFILTLALPVCIIWKGFLSFENPFRKGFPRILD